MSNSNRIFEDEYKLEVVTYYYTTNLGVRKVAQHFGLPTKNYVTRWIDECKRKGLVPNNASKSNFQKPSKPIVPNNSSAVLKQLERENLMLRAELDFLKKVKQLGRGNASQV